MKKEKNKLKNRLKIGILFLGISLLLWNCEKDEFIEQQSETVRHSQTYQKISAKEIPDIILNLKSKFKVAKTSNFKNKSSQTNIFNLLDLDSIIKIKTLEDDISYSIRLKENKEKFINVVAISKKESTNYFVYEYNPTSTFLKLYKLGIKNMGEFEGELRIYTIEEYLEKHNTAQRTATSPCGTITFNDSNNDPTANIGNTNTGSSTYDCVISIITHEVCPFGGTNHDHSVCGPNGTGPGAPYYTVEWDCTLSNSQKTNTKQKSSDPCIGGSTSNSITTPVGINQPTIVPCEENGCETEFINNVLNNVPNLTFEQIQWVSDLANIGTVVDISLFLDSNNTQKTKDFVRSAIELFSLQKLTINDNINTFKSRILKMTKHLKDFGNPDDEFFADYIESIIPDFSSMLVGDVYDIYKLTKNQVHKLTKDYLFAVVVPFAEAAYPFIVYALTEATLGAALPLLAKIPKLPVFNSAWITNIVKQIGVLGVRGTSNSIRIVTTNGNAYTKALELFKGITRNAKSINIQSNGARVADMGNGNFITFRPASASTSGFEATISLDFSGIWSNVRHIKFN